jgi:hypothetical protein
MGCEQVTIGAVAFHRKLRQTLAMLARGKANADSQDGGAVIVGISVGPALLHRNMTEHFRPGPDTGMPIVPARYPTFASYTLCDR